MAVISILHAADCGAPPPPVNGFLQPHTNTTVGSVVVLQYGLGFVPEGEMTAVCGRDAQWTPNPGGATYSPRPTQTQYSQRHPYSLQVLHQISLDQVIETQLLQFTL